MKKLSNDEAKAWFQAATQYCQNDFVDQYGHPRNVPGQVALDAGFKNGFVAGLEYNDQFKRIQSILEDLKEGAVEDLELVVYGYRIKLRWGNGVEEHFDITGLPGVLKRLQEMVDEMELQHGSMGVR